MWLLAGGSVAVVPAQTAGSDVQTTASDLMSAVEGHRYERTTVDSTGALVERAVLDVGRITRNAGELTVPLTVAVYKNNRLERRFSSEWSCAPEAGSMIMSLLVFGEDASKPRMRLEMMGTPLVYPRDVESDRALPDLSMELKVKQGILQMFGARTRISITERRVAKAATLTDATFANGAYTITSRIEIRAYAWGIRVKRVRFESEETISPEEGLLRHVLRREDGGSSVLKRV